MSVKYETLLFSSAVSRLLSSLLTSFISCVFFCLRSRGNVGSHAEVSPGRGGIYAAYSPPFGPSRENGDESAGGSLVFDGHHDPSEASTSEQLPLQPPYGSSGYGSSAGYSGSHSYYDHNVYGMALTPWQQQNLASYQRRGEGPAAGVPADSLRPGHDQIPSRTVAGPGVGLKPVKLGFGRLSPPLGIGPPEPLPGPSSSLA